MKPRTTTVIVLLAFLAATSCLRVNSQPPTPIAPPEIHCSHFLHGYPIMVSGNHGLW